MPAQGPFGTLDQALQAIAENSHFSQDKVRSAYDRGYQGKMLEPPQPGIWFDLGEGIQYGVTNPDTKVFWVYIGHTDGPMFKLGEKNLT